MEIIPFLSHCIKLKTKWVKDIRIKPDTQKLIEERVEMNLEHIGIGKKFLNRIPMIYALRSRIDKWDLIILQNIC